MIKNKFQNYLRINSLFKQIYPPLYINFQTNQYLKFLFSSNVETHNNYSRQQRLENLIKNTFKPSHFEIINESYKHSVPKDSETHFKLIIVSDEFKNKSQVQIHREIYKLLSDEMGEKKDNKLHAISLVTKSPEEWEKLQVKEFKSPSCKGGK